LHKQANVLYTTETSQWIQGALQIGNLYGAPCIVLNCLSHNSSSTLNFMQNTLVRLK